MSDTVLATIRFCVVIVCLTVVLALNATNFDHTELIAIGEMILPVIAAEYFIRKRTTTNDDGNASPQR